MTVSREMGPFLVEGPVDVVDEAGTVHTSHRFRVALCTCRRSRTFPWCDTSHRARSKDAESSPKNRPAAPEGSP
ncbi:CDGSH iron-sulfur domain-containing protein [Streptomyces sp. VRA16 Mangrove soil]|uniref:CDGSH iron-sulfur domain-containing protein n=1 Tax=Streptomyces sp. VRA16 Mangrove soil TaxID=2817434 RepID=UPI001A9E0FBE|nr:CDGSH iron-sulfur domain-containing protein [Streptomyces sp. VRA16 Mangrove soil]MBO1335708.1 CDGSH iron-sulfur domain-containing protein [Streptomyces sp. VRA16 Mangrove soil]